ncbi:hypothetical protein [Shewanella baltica]|uniref:hypothetical protein n=1 Tax=Shewanella baltica TaxID=62322 RepID=UPI0012FC1EC0|nr:hypothetical protein [Shewanella baltica]
MAKMNKLPENLVKIEEYPINDLASLKVTELPITDPLETKLRSILFCIEREIVFCTTEGDSRSEREFLINEAGKNISESIGFLKKSFLTIDIIEFIIFDKTPVEGVFSESLLKVITEYKESDHISILRKGIEAIVEENEGNYYLTEDVKRNIQSKLIINQSKILDLLDFNKITTFDLNSLLSDGISTVGGLLTSFLPLSTILEIYTYLKNKKAISNDSEILFTLSVMYLQKIIAQNIGFEIKKQCNMCKLTSVEIDNIDDNEVNSFILKSTEDFCSKHLHYYLETRKFYGLMGKPLLKHLIASQ